MIDTMTVEELSPPSLDEPDIDPDDDDEYESGPSDFLLLIVFFANVGLLISFVVSLLLLASPLNIGGAPMVFSIFMTIPVALLNARVFFPPPSNDVVDGEDDSRKEASTSDSDDQEDRGSIAPYVILGVMVIVVCIVYWLISLHH